MKQRDHHESCHGYSPSRPGGGEWTHVMVLHDASTVHADSAAEVLEELLPGYDLLDADERVAARIRHARHVAELAQRLHLDRASVAGQYDPSDPRQAGLVHILTMDKSLSLTLELPDAPGEPADWRPRIPLLLLTTSYAPHTEYRPIGGNVVWIDPTSEEAYLASLQNTGIFSYWTRDPAAAPAQPN